MRENMNYFLYKKVSLIITKKSSTDNKNRSGCGWFSIQQIPEQV